MQGDVQVPAGHAWCQARALSRARGKGGGEGGCEGGGEGAAAIGRGAAGGARAARLDAVLAAALPLPLAVRASTAHVALISCDARRHLRGVLSGRRGPEAVWGVQYM